MKARSFLPLLVAVFALVGIVGCTDNSPKATAEKFLNDFYHQEYDKARTVSTQKTIDVIDMLEQFSVISTDSAREEAKKIKIEVVDVKEEGDKAVVKYTMSTEPWEHKLNMVKQNGKWLANYTKEDNFSPENEGQDEMEEEGEETPVADTTKA